MMAIKYFSSSTHCVLYCILYSDAAGLLLYHIYVLPRQHIMCYRTLGCTVLTNAEAPTPEYQKAQIKYGCIDGISIIWP